MSSRRVVHQDVRVTDYMTELVKRLRTLTLALLPVEVDPASIIEPTSRTITPAVIGAYRAAAGDFVEAVRSPLA